MHINKYTKKITETVKHSDSQAYARGQKKRPGFETLTAPRKQRHSALLISDCS
jgi:hypothetical protein